MIGTQQLADLWMHAGLASTNGFDFRFACIHFVHVGGWSADVTDDAFEFWICGHRLDFVNDRLLAA